MRSLGLIRPRTERVANALAPVIAIALGAGIGAVPAAVVFSLLA
jgi:hypothetical protein